MTPHTDPLEALYEVRDQLAEAASLVRAQTPQQSCHELSCFALANTSILDSLGQVVSTLEDQVRFHRMSSSDTALHAAVDELAQVRAALNGLSDLVQGHRPTIERLSSSERSHAVA